MVGMSVARFNLSHGSLANHAAIAARVRLIAQSTGIPIGIMFDVPGAKYRTGPIVAGPLEVKANDHITLTSRETPEGSASISVVPAGIHRDVTPGGTVLVADGLVQLKVLEVHDLDVLCEVVDDAKITARMGVAVPGKAPSMPLLSQEALRALQFAADQQADFVALSTVTQASDVDAARQVLQGKGQSPFLISKIERAAALDNYEAILSASDAIMVARGDLGVDIPLAKVPMVQKTLIAGANAVGKPVITATQMLESMISSRLPTRAEATDVANAIFDGTDAVMLSAESSIGQFPVEAVRFMANVAHEAERALPYKEMLVDKRRYLGGETDDALGYAACQTAFQLNASPIVAFTESGTTAGRVSRYRPQASILALTPYESTQRRLTLRWGVIPLMVSEPRSVEDIFALGEKHARRMPGVVPGSLVVLVAGLPIGVPGGTNLLRVLSVGT